MSSCQEPLLKSDEDDELVFDRTGLLSNKITIKPDIRQRGHTSGRRLQYARTVNLCLAFFALGLCFAIPTATLKDLQAAVSADLSDIEFIYTARYSGYVFGALIGGILFDRYNRQFLLFLSLLATAIGIITIPFCTKLSILMTCTAITGITMGFLDTGGNVWCLDLWGKKSAPFMQTMHFCFGLGAFIAPLVAEPFLSPHLNNSTDLINHINGNKTVLNFLHVRFPHQRYSSRHQISNILSKYINDSEVEGNVLSDPFRTSLKNVRETNEYVILSEQSKGKESIRRLAIEKREIDGDSEIENMTAFSSEIENKTDDINVMIDSNNTYKQNFSGDWWQKNASVVTVTSVISTTTATNVKHRPKKPYYADGNQLSHDDRWSRTSLKSKNPSNRDEEKPPSDHTSSTPTSNIPSTRENFLYDNGTASSDDTIDQLNMGNISRDEPQTESNINYESSFENSVVGNFHQVNTSLQNVENFLSENNTDHVWNQQRNSSSDYINSSVVGNNFTEKDDFVNQGRTELPEKVESTDNSAHTDEFTTVLIEPTYHQSSLPSVNKITETFVRESVKTTTTATNFQSRSESPSVFVTNISDIKNDDNQNILGRKNLRKTNQINDIVLKEKTETDSDLKMGIYTNRHRNQDSNILSAKYLSYTNQNELVDASTEKFNNKNTEESSVKEKTPDKTDFFYINNTKTEENPKKKHGSLSFLSNLFDIMLQHRLGKFEIAYVILGIYIFLVAFVFLVFLCVNPREPRSRQEEELDKSKNITTVFKFSAVILVSLFLCLYVGIEVAVGQLLQTFTIKQYLQLPESTGYFMTYFFWGSFALSRGLSIGLAVKFSGLCLISVDLIICLVTSILLVAGANKMETLLWVGIVVLGFGMAPIFPAAIAWIERYLPINNKTASIFILGAALGQLTIPLIINRFINEEPMVLMYVNIIVNILCFVTFVSLWLLSSRQGEKYKIKIDRNMYQLANFDEVEDSLEMSYGNSHWQNNYNSHILMKKSAGKVT